MELCAASWIYDTGPAEILIETARESCVYRYADPL